MIARCATAADVAAAVTYAREHGLEVSVRGGAHNPAGTAVCDGGLMIDLSLLSHVGMDPVARRATVGGGALLGDVDAAAQAHGLAVPAGLVSHTGVGGLTLGGGMGWLTRKFGLSIDNLVSAEVVTADGQVRRASAGRAPGPVLGHPRRRRQLRRGHLRSSSPCTRSTRSCSSGCSSGRWTRARRRCGWPARSPRAMPPEINAVAGAVNAPPAPFVPPEHHFAPGYVLLLTGFGSGPEHARLVTRIRQSLPPLFDLVTPMPYVELQKLLDEANAWGIHGYEKGTYVEELSDPVIDVITEQVPRKNSPMSVLLFYRLDGAYCQPGDDETAFSGGRSPRYGVFIVGLAPDAGLLDADRGWVRGFWEALRPHAIGSGDGYINGITDFSDDRVRQQLRPGQIRTAGQDQGPVRPGQPIPPQRQHPARLTSPGTSVRVRGTRPDPDRGVRWVRSAPTR